MQSAAIMYIFAGVSAKAEINVEMVCNVISEMLAICFELLAACPKINFWALRHIHSDIVGNKCQVK